jgi:biotin/methionine sulfoxide reductase
MQKKTKITSSHWGAFEVTTDGKTIQSVGPFQHDSTPSDIIQALPKAVHHATRVARPAIRKSWLKQQGTQRQETDRESFVDLPWDEALDIAAQEISRVTQKHGNEAIFGGSYGWASAGRFHHAQGQLKRFLNCAGGFVSSTGSYSAGTSYVMIPHLFGVDHHEFTWSWQNSWAEIIQHTETLVAFGGINPKNAQVNAGGIGDHQTSSRLSKLIAKGARVFTVSPQATDGPKDGTWISVVPGTDVALMFGLAYVLETENLIDRDFIQRCTSGYDALRQYILGTADEPAKTPTWAEKHSGVAAQTIVELARRIASSRTLITVAWSLQRAQHGEQTYWMATALAAMLGQIGLPGGGIGFGYGAVSGIGTDTSLLPGPVFPQGNNPIETSIPVARIADMLLHPDTHYEFNGQTPTYPDIRLIYWAGGNPFHHHQDLQRLEKAWSKPETIIVNEPWWTATAQRADIVFPATTPYEREDIGYDKADPYLFHMPALIEPVGQARSDHSIFRDLPVRLGLLDQFTLGRSEKEWIELIYEEFRQNARKENIDVPSLDELRSKNWVKLDVQGQRQTSGFARFRVAPEKYPLNTPSGRIEIFSETIAGFGYENMPGHAVWTAPDDLDSARYPFNLVSPQPGDKLHSQFESALAEEKDARPMPVVIHPQTALKRGILDGEQIEIFNPRGVCLARAQFSMYIHPKVLSLSTGAWLDLDADGRDQHGNPNVLTRDIGSSPLGQGSTAHTTQVNIRKLTKA